MSEFEKRASNNTNTRMIDEPNCSNVSSRRAPGKSSRGWPAIHEHCQLPIFDWRLVNDAKRNRQLAIGNQQ
jgi:hypothetical protein